MPLLVLPAMSFVGCGWVTCTEGTESGRTRQVGCGRILPSLLSYLQCQPHGLRGWVSHTPDALIGPYTCFRLQKLSLCPPWTCPGTVVNHDGQRDGTKTSPQTKSCPHVLKGGWVPLQSPDAFTNTFFYDPRQQAWCVRIFLSQATNSGP